MNLLIARLGVDIGDGRLIDPNATIGLPVHVPVWLIEGHDRSVVGFARDFTMDHMEIYADVDLFKESLDQFTVPVPEFDQDIWVTIPGTGCALLEGTVRGLAVCRREESVDGG